MFYIATHYLKSPTCATFSCLDDKIDFLNNDKHPNRKTQLYVCFRLLFKKSMF